MDDDVGGKLEPKHTPGAWSTGCVVAKAREALKYSYVSVFAHGTFALASPGVLTIRASTSMSWFPNTTYYSRAVGV